MLYFISILNLIKLHFYLFLIFFGKNRRFSELKVLTFCFLGIYYFRRIRRKIFLMDVKGKMDDRWLSMEEICQYLGVTDDTVHNWIRKKNMPAVKLGRCWKFKKNQVDEWVENNSSHRPKKNGIKKQEKQRC